ncbi:MAG: UMP kinase [Candidatus Moranbacteria bacterium]|nr:UMP kinase [Candidatus Moranbacteria bacterium]NTW45754.1 UMP kinase [Candidatus Moranbacteria bacterium]
MQESDRVIISLGGSLIVPDGIDREFLKSFRSFIDDEVAAGKRFIIVTGGGRTARSYIDAAAEAFPVTDEDRDWMGIHATRLNAHLLRTILRDHAYPRINTNPHDLEDFYVAKDPVLVAAGWRPGFSTDYDATLLGKYLGVRRIVNLSNIDHVYDRDPREHPDAKRYERMTWAEFRALVGDRWSPGMSAPFDPIASRLAEEERMEVAILSGADLGNVSRYLSGGAFDGTLIS